jgi:hypothetical protein
MTVEFVSYSGQYPNLCSGILVLKVDGQEFTFPQYCMSSGGSVWFTKEWEENVEYGPWLISEWPEGFPEEAKAEAIDVVNAEVRQGCCGGCI